MTQETSPTAEPPVEKWQGDPPPPSGVDISTPSPARLYDYFLGGTSNYASDRALGDRLRELVPEVPDAAWANRSFHQRAARWLAECGVRQFIDIGSGLPTAGNTHQIARAVDGNCRVVYVDNDPLVLVYSRRLLEGDPRSVTIQADMRDPESVLGHPDLRAMIDLSRPVGLLMTAVVHFVAPDDDPWSLVARYVKALCPGSHLVLSHLTDEKTPARSVQAGEELYSRASEHIYFRSRADVERFFTGLTFVSPCAQQEAAPVHVGEWGTDDPELADSDGSRWLYCGVGRVS